MTTSAEQPIAREKTEHNFDEGMGQRPVPPWRRRIGRFSNGLARFVSRPVENWATFAG
jgi:hypothetical protein